MWFRSDRSAPGELEERDAIVGACPTTEADLGDGVIPALAYLDAGAHIGVGSDQHVATDAAAELRALEWSQRLALRRRCVLASDRHSAARRMWEEAAASGARACGRPAGAIEVGKRADIVVLGASAARVAGLSADQVLDHWVMAPGSVSVRDVLVSGVHVIRDGRHAAEGAVEDALRSAMGRLRT